VLPQMPLMPVETSEGPRPRGNPHNKRDTPGGLTHSRAATTLRGDGPRVPHAGAGTAPRVCSPQRNLTGVGTVAHG